MLHSPNRRSIILLVAAASFAAAAGSGEPRLLVVHRGGNELSFVDPATGEVETRVRTRQNLPHEVVLSRDGRRAYVSHFGRADAGRAIVVVDLPRREPIRTIDVGGLTRPHAMAIDEAGRIWVTLEGVRAVARVDPWSGVVTSLRRLGQKGTHTLALAPDGATLVAASHVSDTVTFLATAPGATPEHVPLRDGPQGLAFNRDGTRLWVTLTGDGELAELDVATREERARVPVGEFPLRVALTPHGERALVTCARSDELVVVDTSTRTVVGRVPIEGFPSAILLEPDGDAAWVSAPHADRVYRVDLERLEVTAAYETGAEPEGLAWTEPR